MLTIRLAEKNEFDKVRLFYHSLIDAMENAKSLVAKAIALAKESCQKVVRLDVLGGNIPAERLYTGIGFQYVDTLKMYYEDTGWTDFGLYEYPLI